MRALLMTKKTIGIALYYSFNNDTSTTVYDNVGSANGTWLGQNGTYGTLSSGKYAIFNGSTNQVINIPTTVKYPTTNFTFSFWIKYNTTSTGWAKGIFSKWNGNGSTGAYLLIQEYQGIIRADIPYVQADVFDVTTTLNDNKRHYITMTKEGNIWKTYADGVLKNTVTGNYAIDGTSITQAVIGRNHGSNEQFLGGLDEFIIDNKAWSATDVQNYYNQTKDNYIWTPGANTIAYYPLEDDYNDYSGNGKHLTNSGTNLGVSSDGYKGVYLSDGHYAYNTSVDLGIPSNKNVRTIAFWTGCHTMVTGSWCVAMALQPYNTTNGALGVGYTTYYTSSWGPLGSLYIDGLGTALPLSQKALYDSTNMNSHVITMDITNNVWKRYKNGDLFYTGSSAPRGNYYSGLVVGQKNMSQGERNINGYLRQVVLVDGIWSEADALAYHNGTK